MSRLNAQSHARRSDRLCKAREEYIGCLEDLIQYGELDEYTSKRISRVYNRLVKFYPSLLVEFE